LVRRSPDAIIWRLERAKYEKERKGFDLLHKHHLRHRGEKLIQTIASLDELETNSGHEKLLCFDIELKLAGA
jgi:hypothetical protein